MRSSNPTFNTEIMNEEIVTASPGPTMRPGGVASAVGVLLATLAVTAVVGWNAVTIETALGVDGKTIVTSSQVPMWIWGAAIAAFLVALLTRWKPPLARITGVVYAGLEGLFVGAISHIYDARYEGLVVQAVIATVATAAAMAFLYVTRIIRVTQKFRSVVMAATLAICFIYLGALIARMFGHQFGFIHDAGPLAIGFSVVVVLVAAANLLLSFDLVERGVQHGAPRYMEWYAAFGITVSLVWLYLEILRLMSKLRR